MKKVESQELKQYLIDYTASTLESCKLFTKVYGKGFARRRLNIGIDKVYQEEYNDTYAGKYDFLDKSITISNPEESTEFFTISNLEKKNMTYTKTTILHEAIHAGLRKTSKECLDRQIVMGTGLYELYPNDTELGRGLNEGLTNWICKKAGLHPVSYENLTKIVELLEIAVGEQRVMQLGKGDIKRNVTKQLDMSQEEVVVFLARTDEIYHTERRILKIKNIIIMLEKLQQLSEKGTSLSLEEKEEAHDIIQKLKDNKMFMKMIKSREFKQFLETQNTKKGITILRSFALKGLKRNERRLNSQVCFLKEDLFDKYLKEETEQIMRSPRISSKAMKRLRSIYQLLDVDKYDDVDYLERSYNAYRFAIRYKRLEAKRNSHRILRNYVKHRILGDASTQTEEEEEEREDVKQIEFRKSVANVKEKRGEEEKIPKDAEKEEWERD